MSGRTKQAKDGLTSPDETILGLIPSQTVSSVVKTQEGKFMVRNSSDLSVTDIPVSAEGNEIFIA